MKKLFLFRKEYVTICIKTRVQSGNYCKNYIILEKRRGFMEGFTGDILVYQI